MFTWPSPSGQEVVSGQVLVWVSREAPLLPTLACKNHGARYVMDRVSSERDRKATLTGEPSSHQ